MATLHLPFVESGPISQVFIYRLATFDQHVRRSIGRTWTMRDMSWFNRHAASRGCLCRKAILRESPDSVIARADVRFVNRQPGSGTLVLLDLTLCKIGIDPDRINGYALTELTHSAIAAFVAIDMADVGFGVQPAAPQFGLDFNAVVDDDYYFALRAREA